MEIENNLEIIKKQISLEIDKIYGPSGYSSNNWASVRNTNIFKQENSQDLYEGLQASRGLSLHIDKSTEENINDIKKEINEDHNQLRMALSHGAEHNINTFRDKKQCITIERTIARIKELKRFNVLKKVDRVYELGFRTPKLLKYYESIGKKATGFDIVKVNVLMGKYLNYNCVIHDLSSDVPLDFEENSLIIAYHSFEHLPNPNKAIKKVYDGMKKSCFFHIEVPTENIITPHIRVAHCYAFHTGELKQMIENLEFEIINDTPHPLLSFPNQSVLCKLK
jgi:SAM-dependent methyltransferase